MNDLRKTVNGLLAQRMVAVSQVKIESKNLDLLKMNATDIEEAQKYMQEVAQHLQQTAHKKIASVVTRCLSSVFDDPYEFRIDFEQKRGKTEAKLLFVRDGIAVDPLNASGGGVVDVASFALRVACLILSTPPKRKFLVLDEPFKFLNAVYRGRVRAMLETLSEEMKIQFLMITHIAEFETGVVVEIE